MRVRDDVSVTLLTAAGRVVDESGIDGLSVRRVAREANMSTMNIYSRFGNLPGLIDDLVVGWFGELGRNLSSVAATGDAVTDLIAFAQVYRSWALARPAQYRLMMTRCRVDYAPGPPATTARHALHNALAARIAAARAERVDDVAPFSAHEAATVVLSILHGATLLELDDLFEQGESTAWAERFATVIRFGLKLPNDNAA